MGGNNTENGFFFKPDYGDYGPVDYSRYNAALDATDLKLQEVYTGLPALNALVTAWATVDEMLLLFPAAPTYVDGDTFTMPGDFTGWFTDGKRIQIDLGTDGLKSNVVATSSFADGVTTVNLTRSNLTSNLVQGWVTMSRNGVFPYGPGFVNALDFTADGTPLLAGLQAALAAIGTSNQKTLVLPSGAWPITADQTIPANITLRPERGATFAVSNGKILTINGKFEGGLTQVFTCTGTGKVSFGPGSARSGATEWWGAKADGATDCTTAINAAIKCGIGKIVFAEGTYNFTNLVCDDGRVPSPDDQSGWLSGVWMEGAGMGRTILKQTAASGAALFFGTAYITVAAGMRNLTVKGSATEYVAGNHGVDTRNVAWGFSLENVEIRDFGDRGLYVHDNSYLTNGYNIIVRFCWNYGVDWASDVAPQNYGGNESQTIGLKIFGCVNGLHLNNVYSHDFYNVCIDDEWGIGSGHAIQIHYCNLINFYGGYVEWNWAVNTSVVDIESSTKANLNGMLVSSGTGTGYGTPTALVKIHGAGAAQNSIKNCRLGSWGPDTLPLAISNESGVNGNIFEDIQFVGSFTNKYADAGTETQIRDGGAWTAFNDSNRPLWVEGNSTSGEGFGVKVRGDNVSRVSMMPNGHLRFGSGAITPDVDLYRLDVGQLYTPAQFIAGGNLSCSDSAWNGSHVTLGAYHFWVDATGKLRIKSSAPTSDTDGTVVGQQ